VLAIARGGLLSAGGMAYAMNVKSCSALNVESDTGVDARLAEPIMLAPHLHQESLADKRVLGVDDGSDSGHILSMLVSMLVTLLERTGAEVRLTDRWIDFPRTVLEPVTA